MPLQNHLNFRGFIIFLISGRASFFILLFFSVFLAAFACLFCHINFIINLSSFRQQQMDGISIETVLNLLISLERTDIFMMLTLLIQDLGPSFHLLRAIFVTFQECFMFFSYKLCMLLTNFIRFSIFFKKLNTSFWNPSRTSQRGVHTDVHKTFYISFQMVRRCPLPQPTLLYCPLKTPSLVCPLSFSVCSSVSYIQ